MSAYNPLSCDDHLGHKMHFEVIHLAVGYISRYIYGYIVNSYIPMYSCLYCQEYSYTAMYFLQYSLRPQTFGNLIWLNCTAMKLWLSGQMHQGERRISQYQLRPFSVGPSARARSTKSSKARQPEGRILVTIENLQMRLTVSIHFQEEAPRCP